MAVRRSPDDYFASGVPVYVARGIPVQELAPAPSPPDGNIVVLGLVAICFLGLLAVVVLKK